MANTGKQRALLIHLVLQASILKVFFIHDSLLKRPFKDQIDGTFLSIWGHNLLSWGWGISSLSTLKICISIDSVRQKKMIDIHDGHFRLVTSDS